MKAETEKIFTDFFRRYHECRNAENSLRSAVELCCKSLGDRHKILTCGNGGSASDSEHVAGEFLKSFMLKRPVRKCDLTLVGVDDSEAERIRSNLQSGLKCIPLTSFLSYSSAFCNDCDPEFVFAQLVYVLGEPGDILFAFSTSGNSKNIVRAVQVAKSKNMKVIGFTGADGGYLKNECDIALSSPSRIVYEIQEHHLPFYHLICLCVEREMFDE